MALRGIRAAVVGAGIGGLSAALALARRGAAHVHVLERTTEARHGKLAGFGFGLAPNGLTVLRALGVLQSQVSGSDFASKLHPLRRHVNATASGVPLPFSPAAGLDIGFVRRDFGEYLSGVARADVVLALRAALAETNAIVSYETEVLGVSSDGSGQGKPATLALRKTGGTEQSESSPFDIIIAADGIHSTLRQHVYGPEVEGRQPPLFSGVNLYYGLTPASRLGNAGGDEACPPHTLVNLYGTGTSALYFGTGQAAPLVPPRGLAFRDDVFCRPAAYVWAIAHCEDAPAAESWGSAAVVEGLSAIATKHYAENKVLGAIIAAGLRDTASAAEGEVGQQPATFAHFGLFYRPPVAPWSRGPVVLLGDAAHATLPHAGQGANMVSTRAERWVSLIPRPRPSLACRPLTMHGAW